MNNPFFPSRRPFVWSVSCLCLALACAAQPVPEAKPAASPESTGPVPAGPSPIPSQQPVLSPSDLVGPIILRDESIDQVLALLERWTGKTILRPQALPNATFTLSLKGSVPRAEAIRALETLLTMNSIAISSLDDKFLKVTALAAAKSEAPELIDGSTLGLPASGRIVSKVFQLNFLRVAEFMPQIASLLSPGASSPPVIFEKANAALITDSLTNLQRVETLVARLDQPLLAGLQTKFYGPLHSAKASDVVNKIRTILSGPLQNQIGSATTFNPDDRTNQIILIADPRQHPFFDELIAKLDVKSDPNTRNEVIYLLHATAKDVATILSQLVSGQNTATKATGQDNVARGTQNPGGPPTPGGAPQPIASPASVAAAVLGQEPGVNQFSSLLTILPDERSNSLVISGTVDDIRLIRELVGKIDILLAQVRIEVIIAEVTLNDSDKSGISKLNLTAGTDATTGKFSITKFDGKVAGWDISAGVVNPLAFTAAMTDAGSKSHVRILDSETIVTSHNKQAEVSVGQSQPIITGSTATPTSASNTGITTQSQVTYKDIAIALKVTPLIGDDGSVQLTVEQTVDDVLGNVTIDGNQQPIIGHRKASSFLTVKNDEMIVLGGLRRTKKSADRGKVGFLYEIPIISHLFGSRTNSDERTELLLFIRPRVLKPDETSADAGKKIDELSNKGQIKQFLKDPDPAKEPKDSLLEKLK